MISGPSSKDLVLFLLFISLFLQVRLAEIGVDAINSVHDAGYTYGQTTGKLTEKYLN